MSISIIGGADGPTAIFLAGKFEHTFFIAAFLILILFYGVYFTKKIAQRQRGIVTRQLGRGKEKNVRITEIIVSAATTLIVPVELISIIENWNAMPMGIRIAGIIIGLSGDLLFLIAVLTMKDSWRAGIPDRDKTEFVSEGIYRYSRNPAFLGFDMVYTGILLMYFNWLLLVFTIWAIVMLHMQILQEEKYLAKVFGNEYLEYKKQTCRYLGRRKIFT